MFAVASLFSAVGTAFCSSSASVTTDNLKGNTRAEKNQILLGYLINDLLSLSKACCLSF